MTMEGDVMSPGVAEQVLVQVHRLRDVVGRDFLTGRHLLQVLLVELRQLRVREGLRPCPPLQDHVDGVICGPLEAAASRSASA